MASWEDDNHKVTLEKDSGIYRMRIEQSEKAPSDWCYLTKNDLYELHRVFVKVMESPLDPNNPEDITAVEERYQNAAKTSDTLLGAIDMAKEMYKDKQKPVHVFSYDNARQIKQSAPYLSATLDCNPPEDYRPILSINLLNCDHSNEAIILRAL